jgi:hypothetical protein
MSIAHAVHAISLVAPTTPAYFPSGHSVQFSTLVAATRLPYLPSGQPVQVNTSSLEYVPAGHGVHIDSEVDAVVDDVPGGQ